MRRSVRTRLLRERTSAGRLRTSLVVTSRPPRPASSGRRRPLEHRAVQRRGDARTGQPPADAERVGSDGRTPTKHCQACLDRAASRGVRAPGRAPGGGEYLVLQIAHILVSNRDVWAQIVLIVNYDENGGFFYQVLPVPRVPGRWEVSDRLAAAEQRRLHREPSPWRTPSH